MKHIKYIIIFIILSFNISCTKTVSTQTSADEITTELQKVLKETNVKRIIAWSDKTGFPTNISTTLGTSWFFSNGFITIGGYGSSNYTYYWNLAYLDTYEITNVLLADGTTPGALVLHFKN